MTFERVLPPVDAPERETLLTHLDAERATVLIKIDGCSDENLRRSFVPSPTTLLGIVKHLAYVERWWFQACFAGQEMTFPGSKHDWDATFRIQPEETTEQIVELYKAEFEKSRTIVAEADFADHARAEKVSDRTLRWIVVHMIEETSRHNGHLDILRELADGVTGS